jgi:hypothetical protein
MNAAMIASVHVGVIACRQTAADSPILPGSGCRVPDIRARHRAINQMPLGQYEAVSVECGRFSNQKRAEETLESMRITPHKRVG